MNINLCSGFDRRILRLAYSPVFRKTAIPLMQAVQSLIKAPERKLSYLNHLIMFSLHKGCYSRAQEFEKTIRSDPKLKALQLYSIGDFQPSSEGYSSRLLNVTADSRVAELASYLLLGIQNAESRAVAQLPEFHFRSSFFLMEGTGPSPFNPELRDVYLKIGHYRKREHDRVIFQHAIVHELTHLYLRNETDFRICSDDHGIRKFFDEGFAQLCGFRAVNATAGKLSHADTCAAFILKSGINELTARIDKWQNTVFHERHFPLYQASYSFIGYLEKEIGFSRLLKLISEAGCREKFTVSLKRELNSTLNDLLESWSKHLGGVAPGESENFFSVTQLNRISPYSLEIKYESDYPLYPVNDILAHDPEHRQFPVSISRKYRYAETGCFHVECEKDTHIILSVVFHHHFQQVTVF